MIAATPATPWPVEQRRTKPNTYSKILFLLYEYAQGGLQYEYVPGVFLPPGELPMSAFRGPECGGDACNIRIWELRRPQEEKRNFKGIPVKKSRFHYTYKGEPENIITYKLDIPADLLDKVLDLEGVRLFQDQLQQAGYKLQEYEDDADGQDKPGKTVKLVPLISQPELF